jgi:hypothetical protein
MESLQGSAAAWAAPLFSHLRDVAQGTTKQTHKLPPMPCVLWLPDFGAYVRSINLLSASFTTCPNAEGAMHLGEDLAVSVGQDLIDCTGMRVSVRPFHQSH